MQTFAKRPTCLVFTLFTLLAVNLSAQDQPATYPPLETAVLEVPKASIEFSETTFDFGLIEEGEIISHTYTFTNTSDEPLILSNARGSCGCTVPQWPREVISPGETASLTVEFNSKNKKGKRNQKVTITANTSPPQTFIYLTGEIFENKNAKEEAINISINAPKVEPEADCFAIYPNPTAEILKIEMEESYLGKATIISIYSKKGQLMAERSVPSAESTIEFSVMHYPAGTYIANVQVEDRKPSSLCFVVVD